MTVVSKISSGINKVIESKWISKQLEQGLKDPAGTAAKIMVISFITKDAVNCAMYTTQSLNNKKIPEDKRGFVAALDLIQGFINVGGQMVAFYLLDRKLAPKLFGEKYSGTFKDPKTKKELDDVITDTSKSRLLSDNIRGLVKDVIANDTSGKNKKIVNKVRNIIKSKNIDINKISIEEAENVIAKLIEDMAKDSKNFKSYEKGLGLVITALGTNALIKRTLSPLIATPLAGKLSENWDKKHKVAKDRMYYEVKAVEQGEFKQNDVTQDSFQKSALASNSK